MTGAMNNRADVAEKALMFAAFVTLGGLLVYALALKQGLSPSVVWFWLSLGIIDGAIVLQIVGRLNRPQAKGDWLILAQIVALKVLLSLMVVWAAPNGLWGEDSHFNLSATKAVGRWGWPVPTDAGLLTNTRDYSLWPGMDFLSIALSTITGISHLELARYLPGSLTALSVVFIYAVGKRIFGTGFSGLLAALAMAQMTTLVVKHAEYVREAAAFPLFMAVVLMVMKGRLNIGATAATILLLGTLVLYHHLTSFLALLLLLSTALAYWLIGLPLFKGRDDTVPAPPAKRSERPPTLAVFHATAFFAYAVYIGPLIIEIMVREVERLVLLDVGSSPFLGVARDATQQFVYYGRWAATVLMVLTLLFYVWHRFLILKAGPRWSPAEIPLMLWVVVVGAWTVAISYGRILLGAFPHRLLLFGYLFLVLLFAQVALHYPGPRTRLAGPLRALGVVTVSLFVAINLLGLPPYVYDAQGQPRYQSGEVSLAYPRALYAASEWQANALPPSAILAGDETVEAVFGGLSQREVAKDPEFYENGDSGPRYDGFVLHRDMRQMTRFEQGTTFRYFPLDDEKLERLTGQTVWGAVYDNGNTLIFVRLGNAPD